MRILPPKDLSMRGVTAILLAVAVFGLGWASRADAVLLATATGTGNDVPILGFDEFDCVGRLNGASGTYLGNGWVITANHVGPGDIDFGGITYQYIPGSEIRLETFAGVYADLVMFQIWPEPPLVAFPLAQFSPLVGEFTTMVGNGRDRGTATSFDPNGPGVEPPLLSGWNWAGTSTIRWGTNIVAGFPPVPISNTISFFTDLDELNPTVFEGQATSGDSGGAVFVFDPINGQELAGIMFAIAGASGQPASTSLYTNQTVIARIDSYRTQIEANIAAPEPEGALYPALLLLSLLAARRARRASPVA